MSTRMPPANLWAGAESRAAMMRHPRRAAASAALAGLVLLGASVGSHPTVAADPIDHEAHAVMVLEDMADAMSKVRSVAFTVDLYEADVLEEADGSREIGVVGVADLESDRVAATVVHGASERDHLAEGAEVRYIDGSAYQRAGAADDWVAAAGEYDTGTLPWVVDPGPAADRIVSFITEDGGWRAEYLGTRACGEARCHIVRLQLARDGMTDEEVASAAVFEILVDTYSARLVQVDGYAASRLFTESPDRRLRISARFSDYDEPVTIESPTPASQAAP